MFVAVKLSMGLTHILLIDTISQISNNIVQLARYSQGVQESGKSQWNSRPEVREF